MVKEKRSKRDGAYLENVGTYNPMVDPAEVNLNHDRIQYWIGVGAQPTETVTSLIKNNPVQTEEEKAAALQARAAKKAAAEAEGSRRSQAGRGRASCRRDAKPLRKPPAAAAAAAPRLRLQRLPSRRSPRLKRAEAAAG